MKSRTVARVDRIVEDSASYAKPSSAADPSPTDRRPPAPSYWSSLIEVEDFDAPIIQQEIFGTVATFEVFDDEKDGGISAAVDTRSRRSPA
jgi:betaine-aldehyde dehydrogenase